MTLVSEKVLHIRSYVVFSSISVSLRHLVSSRKTAGYTASRAGVVIPIYDGSMRKWCTCMNLAFRSTSEATATCTCSDYGNELSTWRWSHLMKFVSRPFG
jgi:hypothetical protein